MTLTALYPRLPVRVDSRLKRWVQIAGIGTTTFGLQVGEPGTYPGEGAIDLAGSTAINLTGLVPANYLSNATTPTSAAMYLTGNNFTFTAGASTNTTGGGTNGNGAVVINKRRCAPHDPGL